MKATAHVAAVLDGGTLILTDGREVQPAPVAVPRQHWRGRKSVRPIRRFATRARNRLKQLLEDRDLVLDRPARPDRYGRERAQIYRLDTDGSLTWIQAELVRAGLGRVETDADTRACAGELLRIEAQARRERQGLWRLELFAPRTVAELRGRAGSWQIVEGRIRNIAEVRGRIYLNFGKDWHSDFTVSIAPSAARLFADGFWRDKADRPVRVRGQVERFNGPMIEVTHPEQLEWPKPESGPARPSGE